MQKICAIVLVASLFVGCQKDFPTSGPVKAPEKVTDLSVASNFDWNATSDVKCNVASATKAKIYVSDSPSGEPFAVFFTGASASEPVSLSVPASVQTLYMSYETVDGPSTPQAVSVADNAVSFNVGANNRPFDDSDMEEQDGLIFIPSASNGWGTMMFEDMWPSYGDYDFNDLVFSYQVKFEFAGASNVVKSMLIGIRMKAIGGSTPYQLYLQMHGVENGQIGSVSMVSSKNAVEIPAMTLQPPYDSNKNRALFRFDNVYKNTNRPAGSIWLNTEPGHELSDDQLVEVFFQVDFTAGVKLENVNFAGFDFFIAQEADSEFGPEVHRCNYEPLNQNLYFSMISDPRLDYYKSKENLVWAINIPAYVAHSYEKIDFLKAYPEFATWVQSGGQQAKDWYERGNSQYLVSKK